MTSARELIERQEKEIEPLLVQVDDMTRRHLAELYERMESAMRTQRRVAVEIEMVREAIALKRERGDTA